MESKKKLYYPDVLRCAATLLVIALHAVSPTVNAPELFGTRTWWLCNAVNMVARAGVPCFFMLSGFLLLSDPKTAELSYFYKKRFLRLLVPFLFWNLFYFLCGCLLDGQAFDPLRLLRELAGQGTAFHLWFLYQMAGIYLLAPFLKKIVDHASRREIWILLGVILLVPTFLSLLNVVQPHILFQPFAPIVEGYAGFFLLGYLLGTGEHSKTACRLSWALGAAAVALGALGNYVYTTPHNMNLFFNGGYFLTQYCSGAAVFLAIKALFREGNARAADHARALAALSFGVYLSHAFFLRCCDALLLGTLGLRKDLPVCILVSFAASAVLSALLTYALSKIPYVRRIIL